ncbi:VWA domain-containing protein [Arthrobacter sp. 24S4-2]|uniref:substrate-binding domain-containing protein n=1 Tax=Arthrobacter sp. 24S4-2 TaxID=2575374 RepID=UPI0010C7D720|nr:substrate-binding domain-containing protein [Arthrobacter sp. 24S4-2]QCO96576.1 VWA domain-containing protein [Arthrobacter sp. 24S4-2]
MSGRRAAGPQRHGRFPRKSPFFWPRIVMIVGVMVVIAVAAAAVIWITGSQSPLAAARCGVPAEVRVGADATIAPALQGAAAKVPTGACVKYTIETQAQPELAARVTAGKDAPDLWVSDSAVRIRRVVAATAPEIAVPSLASTPGVIVGRQGDDPGFATWLNALQAPGVRFGDPLLTGSGEVALLGALSEVEAGRAEAKTLQAATAQLVQSESQRTGEKLTDAKQLEAVASAGGFAIVTEQAWLAFAKTAPASHLSASMPHTGSASLDYPMALTAAGQARGQVVADAAKALASATATEDGSKALADNGLRPADGSRTPDQRGVGSVVALKPASAESVQRTLKGWSLQAIPFRSLVVMDVSGSMNFRAGGQTRMQLTQEAAIAGSKLFPNTAALGMWAFSIGLGGGNQDYVELDPIRKMDQVVDGVTQRDRLVADISGLDKRTGGATGLYDSTLAAYRTVKANYDARAINSVILFTDGANEDADSLSREELLEALQRERDPAKPVVIVSIGITGDADAETLRKISEATGGTSYVATNPQDIPSVFVDALQARAQ